MKGGNIMQAWGRYCRTAKLHGRYVLMKPCKTRYVTAAVCKIDWQPMLQIFLVEAERTYRPGKDAIRLLFSRTANTF